MAESLVSAELSKPLNGWTIGRCCLIYFGGAVAVAALLSTQFLAQPFVWRYFAADEILAGWGLILRDRLFVAGCIALMLSLSQVVQGTEGAQSLTRIFLAVVAGAFLGETLLLELDPLGDRTGLLAVVGRAIRWGIAAGAGCFMFHLWRQSEFLAAREHAEEIRRLRAERSLTRLRIEALQRQIEPHFLFNTFATIRRLYRSSPSDGQLLLSRFFDFLRGSLDCGSGAVSRLGDELAIASAYLHICAMRMDGLLMWRIDVDEALNAMEFPRFGLSTLLENAVKHGIAPSQDGGSIVVKARRDVGALEVAVEDTGVGFSAEHGHGLGLANIREQLVLRYGSAASLSLTSNRPRGVRAVICVPIGQSP